MLWSTPSHQTSPNCSFLLLELQCPSLVQEPGSRPKLENLLRVYKLTLSSLRSLTFVSEILSIIGPPSGTQIQAVLLEIIRPAFERARPNENLNMNTATKAKRRIGADLAYHDDTESDWKNDLGLVDIVLWCLEYLQASL